MYGKSNCKGRVHTYGKIVEMTNNDHNHAPIKHETDSYAMQINVIIIHRKMWNKNKKYLH